MNEQEKDLLIAELKGTIAKQAGRLEVAETLIGRQTIQIKKEQKMQQWFMVTIMISTLAFVVLAYAI